MVSKIRIYIEGDPALRQGFRTFLKPIYDKAQSKKIKIEPPKLCGSRESAYKAFKTAITSHPDAFIVLVVDSEERVEQKPWEHLKNRDGWDSLSTDDSQCYLMVQTMEAWFLADVDALRRYYGQGFQESAISRTSKVEEIDKETLLSDLRAATRNTSKKKYNKTRHAPDLMGLLDVAKVRNASPNCDRLFTTLTQIIEAE